MYYVYLNTFFNWKCEFDFQPKEHIRRNKKCIFEKQ